MIIYKFYHSWTNVPKKAYLLFDLQYSLNTFKFALLEKNTKNKDKVDKLMNKVTKTQFSDATIKCSLPFIRRSHL